MLAKRLLNADAASSDVEALVISSLRGTCDAKFTNTLQHMLQDLQVSKELQTSYRDWWRKNLTSEVSTINIDDSYKVLYSGFWPLSASVTSFTPPEQILECCNQFNEFYNQKYEGRKLQWLWSMSRAELKANYVNWKGKIPYIFQLSAFQLAILLQFNRAEKVSYTEMKVKTDLDNTILDPCLGSLVKAKVLMVQPAGGKPEQGSEYSLNYGFKHRNHKVPLYIMIKSERAKETEGTYRAQREDRRLVIQVSTILGRLLSGIARLYQSQRYNYQI